MASSAIDLYVDAVDGPPQVLHAAPQLLVQVDPDQSLPNGRQLLQLPPSLDEPLLPQQRFLLLLVSMVVLSLEIGEKFYLLPQDLAVSGQLQASEVVELAGVEGDEEGEVGVDAQQVPAEVPADAVQLHYQSPQVLREVDHLPLQLRAAGGKRLQGLTVALPVLDDPLQVEAEGAVHLLHQFPHHPPRRLLLDRQGDIRPVPQIPQQLSDLPQHPTASLRQRPKVLLLDGLDCRQGGLCQLLGEISGEGGPADEEVDYCQFFKRFREEVLPTVGLEHCEGIGEPVGRGGTVGAGVFVVEVEHVGDLIGHEFEEGELVGLEFLSEEVVIFEDEVVLALGLGLTHGGSA